MILFSDHIDDDLSYEDYFLQHSSLFFGQIKTKTFCLLSKGNNFGENTSITS